MFNKILILSDNFQICKKFVEIIASKKLNFANFTFAFSYNNSKIGESFINSNIIAHPINVKQDYPDIIKNYDLVISAHCKQLFPAELVKAVKCINVHPGLNPFNRGWYPQVFSILNKMPLGATIHEIDEELDHGPIICQKEVDLFAWDTSLSAYERVQNAEIELLEIWLPIILSGSYDVFKPDTDGNLNLKSDFNSLCKISLEKKQTIGETIDLLRALSHGDYKNAWYIDEHTGKKVYLQIQLNPE
jgi:methionyl-tRNA formyltransferase